ncbi:MAG: ATP-dependent DNA helicase RecG [Oscillospiraceae bacterium]|jgi:ATP-dependent DNA helicase RecG|nr:ATP-dependent DNA helicase RecG [Oscillospiraceae bacterium]
MKNESLDISIRYIKGVGETREKLMNKLDIRTLRDLVGHFPRAYEDRTIIKSIGELIIGETVCVRAMAAASPVLSHIRKGLDLVKLRAVDETGSLEITFFNQSFIKDAIKQGEIYIFYGKISGTLLRPEITNPLFEHDFTESEGHPQKGITGRIVPIYPLTAGLSQKMVMNAVRSGLDKCADELPDVLPDSIILEYQLCRARYAYENIHFPSDMKGLDIARRRLIFEELFVLAAAMKLLRGKRDKKTSNILKSQDFNDFYKILPYEPTGAQKRAINEAANDMVSDSPMSRLIQGDVGSGKTLIAAACCWMAWRSGYQSAFMAPTEILAKQHFSSLSKLLEPLGMRVGILTGSMSAKSKRETYEKLKCGEIDLIIGTHALISEGVTFKDLALVITDEQHRFGVNQRSLLSEKGDSPHVLVMSATPIPRTLALIIYGELDVSIIDEMPPGRRKIETHIVDERHRKRAYGFVEKLVNEGRQAYIICPMVEEEEETVKSVKEYHEMLSTQVFPNLNIALVHGKMPVKQKDAAMSAFASGDANILVATTVVEVGVDVANAALIIIENADRFGLSQLHQLRGRVGRGEHDSYCILFRTDHSGSGGGGNSGSGGGGSVSQERLEVMKSTDDGFKIAEEDLKLRGPGDFFGSRQHGLPEMRIANFATDMQVLNQAQKAAENLLRSDPKLSLPENRKLAWQINRLFEINVNKMN